MTSPEKHVYMLVLTSHSHPLSVTNQHLNFLPSRLALSQDSQNPQDEGRLFIFSYFLSSDMISIFEKSTRNSGIISGQFLEKTRIPKPGCTVDKPEFYGPADFAIGDTVEGRLPSVVLFTEMF